MHCREPKGAKVFWFFFSKKNKNFFLKKEAKTFAPWPSACGWPPALAF
jgi:hypothetical protein